MIILAAQVAAEAHKGQTRKDGVTPYIIHPIRVAGMIATRRDAQPEWVAAAYLHDVLEDADLTIEKLKLWFNNDVCSYVQSMTCPPGRNRRERKSRYNAQLACAPLAVKVIKAYDRIDNLQDFDLADPFSKKYAEETLDLVVALGYSCCDEVKQLQKKAKSILEYWDNKA